MKTAVLKPAPGMLVRVPERSMRPLSPTGELVELTPYWLARLRDGDVIAASETPKAKAKPADK